jgi:DNA-binding XRE family transcriptional regulator
MTRVQLAKAVGLSRVTIWRIETGKYPARLDQLEAIAKTLKTTLRKLVD